MVAHGSAPTLHVGVPMWAQRAWVGRFFPVDTRPGGELAAYSRFLDAVEGNTTFYASPSPSTVAKWAANTSPGFEFTFKLPRTITHERRLRDTEGPMRTFLDLMTPLADRIGAMTVQLPASFGPTDLGVLGAFVGRLSTAWRWCVEVRHPAFFAGAPGAALDRLLARHGVERVVFDTTTLFAAPPTSPAERVAWEKKPRVPVRYEALTDRPIVRYLGRDDLDSTVAGWAPWVPVVAGWIAEGRRPTCFVHTPDDLASPGLARDFHAAVAALVPSLAPLPEPPAVGDATPVQVEPAGPEQASLF